MSIYEIVGKVALQLVPAGMGAVLARSQLGLRDEEDGEEARRESYAGELFLMAAGALFLAFNVAPDRGDRADRPPAGQPLVRARAARRLARRLLHAFVYAVGFAGQHSPPEDRGAGHEFLRLTLPGYAVVLVICTYVLWTFGRLDGLPAAVGASPRAGPGVPGGLGRRDRPAGALMAPTTPPIERALGLCGGALVVGLAGFLLLAAWRGEGDGTPAVT